MLSWMETAFGEACCIFLGNQDAAIKPGEYAAGSWIHHFYSNELAPYTDDEGGLIHVKVGHLA